MLSWLGTHIPRTIKFADIRPPETKRSFVTFKANGNFYFVDEEHCHNKAFLARLIPQKGWASQATEEDNKISNGPQSGGQSGDPDKETGIVYGPMSSEIKMHKLLQLSGCCLFHTLLLSSDKDVVLMAVVLSPPTFLSVVMTHWLNSSNIHKIRWQPGSETFEVEMLSWLGTHIPRTINFADILPLESEGFFEANGNFYFVDEEHCHNEAFLARLTPQKRWPSQAPTTEEDNKINIGPQSGGQSGDPDKETGVVYYGPRSSMIEKTKHLYLPNCFLSILFVPDLMGYPDNNVILTAAVQSVLCLSAAFIHWFTSPYIHKIRWQPGSNSFEVETPSFVGKRIPRTIIFADIRPPETQRPFVTFKAYGNFYFVDEEHCHNKALWPDLPHKKLPSRPSRICDLRTY